MITENSFIIFIFILLLKIIINALTGYSDERLRLIIFESVIIIGYEYLSQLRTTVKIVRFLFTNCNSICSPRTCNNIVM